MKRPLKIVSDVATWFASEEGREFGEGFNLLIPKEAQQECWEPVETRSYGPERTMKAHECGASHWDDEIVRYSSESRRVWDKEPTHNTCYTHHHSESWM